MALNLQILLLWTLSLSSGNLAAGKSCFFPYEEASGVGINRRQVVIFEAQGTRMQVHAFVFEMQSKVCPLNLTLKSAKRGIFPVRLRDHAGYPEQLRKLLIPLMQFAKLSVPPKELNGSLAVFRFDVSAAQVMAGKQRRHIAQVVSELMRRYGFMVPANDDDATGLLFAADLAMFRWVAVNFLAGTFDQVWSASYATMHVGKKVGFADAAHLVYVHGKNDVANSQITYHWPCGHTFGVNLRVDPGFAEARLGILGYTRSLINVNRTIVSPCLHPNFTGAISSIPVRGASSAVAGANRTRRCGIAVAAWLREWAQGRSEPLLPAERIIFPIGDYYDRFKYWGMHSPGMVTVREVTAAADLFCQQTGNTSLIWPAICVDTMYMVVLLRQLYGFNSTRGLLVTPAIRKITAATGILGFAIEQAVCSERPSADLLQAVGRALPTCELVLLAVLTIATLFYDD